MCNENKKVKPILFGLLKEIIDKSRSFYNLATSAYKLCKVGNLIVIKSLDHYIEKYSDMNMWRMYVKADRYKIRIIYLVVEEEKKRKKWW